MLALTSATGKLGSAVLSALLDNRHINPKELVVCTSSNLSSSKLDALREKKLTIRHADFDNPSSLEKAFTGCDRLFLVSTPRIAMDYDDAPLWSGREAHHRAAIDAAIKVGVKHIYYTSLAFKNPSKASVMRAHIRTEAYLTELKKEGKVDFTVIREGLYNESWPLYFGYYWSLKEDRRIEVLVAGEGQVSWTAIADMGFGTAKILSSPPEKWKGKTVYLSQNTTWSLSELAGLVSKIRGKEVRIRQVSRKEFEDWYVQNMDVERASVEWWSSAYDALKDGECDTKDTTLEDILREAGRMPKPFAETVHEMLE